MRVDEDVAPGNVYMSGIESFVRSSPFASIAAILIRTAAASGGFVKLSLTVTVDVSTKLSDGLFSGAAFDRLSRRRFVVTDNGEAKLTDRSEA
jgi:hypothetical protein